MNNFKNLPSSNKKRLVILLILTILPIISYCIFCISYLVSDKITRLNDYNSSSLDEAQQAILDKLNTTDKDLNPDANAYYTSVHVGVEVYSIYNISPSTGTFDVDIVIWFDFDYDEFINMVYKKIAEEQGDNFNPSMVTEEDYQNHLPAKDGNYDLGGKGQFHIGFPMTYSPDHKYITEDGSNRYFQARKINATINKKFDSPRYPLESLQFKIHIRPLLDAQYIRYIPDQKSMLSAYYNISGGYHLLDDNSFKTGIFYYESENYNPSLNRKMKIQTEFETNIIVNRKDASLFLKVFITLFAIMVWTFFALYDGAYNKEYSIGTLGTSMFGAVSAILIGVGLTAESITFSLVNLINVFGLAVILISTVIFMRAKKIIKSNDEVAITTNQIYVKMMFWVLLAATIIIFMILPVSAFIW